MKLLLQTELSHFRQLSQAAQRLLISFSVFEFTYPLFFIFINVFILRQTSSIAAVGWYNLGTFITLPLFFMLNGWALRRVPIQTMYTLGLICQGLVASSVFYFPFNTLPLLFVFGGLQGAAMGFYWGNRNYLSLEVTEDDHRSYFTGLEIVLATIAGTVTPFVVGWLIVLGEKMGFYTAEVAYRGLSIVGLGALLYAGWLFSSCELPQFTFKKLWITQADSRWWLARWVELFRGVQNGFDLFIVPVVVFVFLGKEGILGSIQSASAIGSAILLYYVGRKLKPALRLSVLSWGVGLLILISLIFTVGFSPLAALIYVLLLKPIEHTNWVSSNPIAMKVIDEQDGGDSANNYAYVVDRELFLNIGRVIGVGVFLILISRYSQAAAVRVVPLLAAVCQLGLLWTVRKLVR
jgi:YQGE family putative transporter